MRKTIVYGVIAGVLIIVAVIVMVLGFNTQMNSPGASTFSKGRVFDCPEPETSERKKGA